MLHLSCAGGGREEAGGWWWRADGEDAQGLQDGVRAVVPTEAQEHYRPGWGDDSPGDLRHAVLQSREPHGSA